MRNLFALLIVAAAFTFTSCDKKGGETTNADTTKKADSAAVDPSTQMKADSASMKADSAAMKADTAAKK